MNRKNKPLKSTRDKPSIKAKPPKLSLINPALLEASKTPQPSELKLPFFQIDNGAMTPRKPRVEDSLSNAFKNFSLN